jgi:alkylation response protein AidB-like acyl-CoA dehydrogenase
MDFSLSESQQQVKDLVGQILNDYTSQEQLRRLDQTGYMDESLWRQLCQSGIHTVALDESLGGSGLNFETLCIVLEQIGLYVAPIPAAPLITLGSWSLQGLEHVAIVRQLLLSFSQGDAKITGALCKSPQQSTFDPSLTVIDNSDQTALITGTKKHIPAILDSTHCWIATYLGQNPAIFIVDLAEPTVSIKPQTITTGQYQGDLIFNQTKAHCVALGDIAEQVVSRAHKAYRLSLGSLAIGLCEGMLKLATSYTQERQQFGSPIGRFQAVAHRLADSHIQLECLKATQTQAVSRFENTTTSPIDLERALGSAHFFASEALHKISHTCQQVHGGTGVDKDYPLFRYCLWARQIETAMGSSTAALQRIGQSYGLTALN